MESTSKQRVAYSYLRFSSPEQAKGDSFRRQFELAAKYAQQNGLEIDESISFYDLGVSAYRGANSEIGQLGILLEAVKTGLIPSGAVILVESLDRISRQSARKALRIIEGIVELGVSIVTLSDGREYTLESLDSDPLNLLIAILTFIRANEESTIKSQRVAAAWEAKRRQAPQTIITSRCPGWMRISDDKTRFILVPDKVKVIRHIFNMAASGTSFCAITRALNLERTPPLRARGRQGKYWTISSVKMILQSETVRGTLTPFHCRFVNGKLQRTPLPPIENYYPRIITNKVYKKTQAAISERRPKSHGLPKRPTQNIIGYVTRCGYCDSGMVKAWGHTGRYLICRSNFLRAGCSCQAILYHEVETSFLRLLQQQISTSFASKERSLRIWCIQIKSVLDSHDSIDKSELNRLIRKECVSIKIFYDTGKMEVQWRRNHVSEVCNAFTPSAKKSKRSIQNAQKKLGATGSDRTRST
jgi:DNA invertase Pin-like site-specific DNA recombinase